MGDPIVIASDHRGASLKALLCARLESIGVEVRDLGTQGDEPVDYPRFAGPAARAVSEGDVRRGIVICGSGLGRAPAGRERTPIDLSDPSAWREAGVPPSCGSDTLAIR